MSTTAPVSESVSEHPSAQNWQLTADDAPKPTCLVVQLRRYAHVLPYFRFVYAEGDNTRVKIAFASHLITITGHGLAALLAALSSQRVVRVVQPSENDAKFGVRGTGSAKDNRLGITDITVEEFR
jgi:hypothetical protein